MEFQGWSDGLALRPRDYLGKGESLAAVVMRAGPYQGEPLYLLALGTAATMARLHLGGIAGLRLSPGNVMIGPRGQAFFAPGPRDSEFPAHDVKDWADMVLFAATGRVAAEGVEPDLDRLLPALRAVIDECRRSDPASRPTAMTLVRILLGHSGAAQGAQVHELLLEAERRTRPYEPPPPVIEQPATPLWRKPAYLAGTAIGVLAVALAAGVITLIADQAGQPAVPEVAGTADANKVISAIGRRTATFHQRTEGTPADRAFTAEGRLSFDGGATTTYDMNLTCGNDPQPTQVFLYGSRGVAGGVPFDAGSPSAQSCSQWAARPVRVYSSPGSIKALLDAAGPFVASTPEDDGRTITGSVLAHRVRGEDRGLLVDGTIEFTLHVDARGLPVRFRLHMESRVSGAEDVETVYRDWRPFEAIKGETPNG